MALARERIGCGNIVSLRDKHPQRRPAAPAERYPKEPGLVEARVELEALKVTPHTLRCINKGLGWFGNMMVAGIWLSTWCAVLNLFVGIAVVNAAPLARRQTAQFVAALDCMMDFCATEPGLDPNNPNDDWCCCPITAPAPVCQLPLPASPYAMEGYLLAIDCKASVSRLNAALNGTHFGCTVNDMGRSYSNGTELVITRGWVTANGTKTLQQLGNPKEIALLNQWLGPVSGPFGETVHFIFANKLSAVGEITSNHTYVPEPGKGSHPELHTLVRALNHKLGTL